MTKIKVNKTTSFEFNGQLYATMADVEIAVRKVVIAQMVDDCKSIDEATTVIAENWVQIKNAAEAAFAGIK